MLKFVLSNKWELLENMGVGDLNCGSQNPPLITFGDMIITLITIINDCSTVCVLRYRYVTCVYIANGHIIHAQNL